MICLTTETEETFKDAYKNVLGATYINVHWTTFCNHGFNPIHIFLEVRPIDYKVNYVWVEILSDCMSPETIMNCWGPYIKPYKGKEVFVVLNWSS